MEKKNINQITWKKALKFIPTGNMFLSKNPSRFIKNIWPTYFHKSEGCKVWDLNNKKYFDLSLMGVGTNVLGYTNPKIEKAVMQVLKKGNMTTLNCPEEVELAKQLVEIHPWANMARFAKTGGETNAIAVRLARTYTKKNIILICGYHGWHDWYLSANLINKNRLDTHLFKDLKFEGIPSNLKGTTYTFKYNDISTFEKLIKKYKGKIAAVKMEVQREVAPKKNFLKKIRSITKRNGILLIFDECTTGFREYFGGLHLKYRVYPDLVMYGKALGNGYPITALLGRKEIMKCAEKTFISSTFWSDRIGTTAGLATLKEMKRIKSWIKVKKIGKKVKNKINIIAKQNNINISFKGMDSLITFEIIEKNPEKIYKYITKRMLQFGFLAKNSIYISTSHNDKILRKYFKCLSVVFKELSIKNFK